MLPGVRRQTALRCRSCSKTKITVQATTTSTVKNERALQPPTRGRRVWPDNGALRCTIRLFSTALMRVVLKEF